MDRGFIRRRSGSATDEADCDDSGWMEGDRNRLVRLIDGSVIYLRGKLRGGVVDAAGFVILLRGRLLDARWCG